MRLKVLRYDKLLDFHVCEDADDCTRATIRVDLHVHGPEGVRTSDYVGRVVEVDDLHPYLYIAQGVRFVDEQEVNP